MAEETVDEGVVLLEQLDEVLEEPILDGEDAFEVAVLAGLAHRLGVSGGALDTAMVWRDGEGADLLDAYWSAFDPTDLIAGVDEVIGGDTDEEEVEEALLDVDEAVVAAVWCGRASAVTALSAAVESTIRAVPEVFASLAEDGSDMAREASVAENADAYAFWFAVADAGEWADDG